MQANSHWQRQTERGALLGMRIVVWVFKLLGARISKIFLLPILLYFYLTGTTARLAILQFYKQLQLSGHNIKPTPWQNIKNFGFGIIDRLSLWLGNFDMQQLHAHNREVLIKHIEKQQGGIIFSSHLGNFELCRGAGSKRLPVKLNVLVDIDNARKINDLLKVLNADFELNIINIKNLDMSLVILLKQKVDAGEFVVIAADRINLKGSDKIMMADFLGAKAPFPVGPFVLAKVLSCAVFCIFCFSSEDGKYDVYFDKLFDEVKFSRRNQELELNQYVQKWANTLAGFCVQYPNQWFNFYNFWALPNSD